MMAFAVRCPHPLLLTARPTTNMPPRMALAARSLLHTAPRANETSDVHVDRRRTCLSTPRGSRRPQPLAHCPARKRDLRRACRPNDEHASSRGLSLPALLAHCPACERVRQRAQAAADRLLDVRAAGVLAVPPACARSRRPSWTCRARVGTETRRHGDNVRSWCVSHILHYVWADLGLCPARSL